jgi:hypothetical protein
MQSITGVFHLSPSTDALFEKEPTTRNSIRKFALEAQLHSSPDPYVLANFMLDKERIPSKVKLSSMNDELCLFYYTSNFAEFTVQKINASDSKRRSTNIFKNPSAASTTAVSFSQRSQILHLSQRNPIDNSSSMLNAMKLSDNGARLMT